MTETLYGETPYAADCAARVLAHVEGGVALDRTVFYAAGGGQPGDAGVLRHAGGEMVVVDTRRDAAGTLIHILAEGAEPPPIGAEVTVMLDWPRRHAHMRMHSALHLLCACVEGDVTGGQIGAEKSRLDFNIPAGAVDKDALEARLNALVAQDAPIRSRWIRQAELDAQPELVRTLSVKPPRGEGQVRLVEIDSIDLQPCGGTHVARTGEIGTLAVKKIENKGRQNRRIVIAFA